MYTANREQWGLSREKNKAYFRTDSLVSLFLIVTFTVKSKAANLILCWNHKVWLALEF